MPIHHLAFLLLPGAGCRRGEWPQYYLLTWLELQCKARPRPDLHQKLNNYCTSDQKKEDGWYWKDLKMKRKGKKKTIKT